MSEEGREGGRVGITPLHDLHFLLAMRMPPTALAAPAGLWLSARRVTQTVGFAGPPSAAVAEMFFLARLIVRARAGARGALPAAAALTVGVRSRLGPISVVTAIAIVMVVIVVVAIATVTPV